MKRHGTVDEMVRDYLERPDVLNAITKGTLRNYKTYRGHIGAVFGRAEPRAVKQSHIVAYLRTCPRKSARGEIGLLSMAYVGWMDLNKLDFNPCFGVRVKLPKSKRTRLITEVELAAIITAAPERIKVAIEIAYATGLRISDVCSLRWADLAENVETQKTGARQRFTRTDDWDAIQARCKALQAKLARVHPLHVLNARGGVAWEPGALRKHWDKACLRAGVEDAHFHDIRATGATRLYMEGGIRAAQLYLGHKTEQTTWTYIRDRIPNVVTPLSRKASVTV